MSKVELSEAQDERRHHCRYSGDVPCNDLNCPPIKPTAPTEALERAATDALRIYVRGEISGELCGVLTQGERNLNALIAVRAILTAASAHGKE